MKRFIAFFLSVVMCLSLGCTAFASSISSNPTVVASLSEDVVNMQPAEIVTAIAEAESYLTDWFSDKLSEHYTLYNFNFTFSTADYENGEFNSYGYLEVDHHLLYQALDELPYVQGVMDSLAINSMEALVAGDYNELENTSTVLRTRSGEAMLTDSQTQYLGAKLQEQFAAIKADMGDFTASYFFHFVADFDGANINNPIVTLEAEDVGYLPAEECLPGTAEELYADGIGVATQFVATAMSFDETEAANTPVPATYANYDRIAARNYALAYANNPSQSCKCGNLSYNSSDSFPDGVTYSAWNNSVYPYFSLFCHNDCADFVSQAMSAGGLPESGTWFRKKNVQTQSWGESWTSVSSMKSYMTSKGYWSASNYANCNAGNILLTSSSHVTMITLNNGVSHCYTGHTNDRNNVSFSNKAGYTYYAINLV